MKRRTKNIIKLLTPIPFIFGFIGYLKMGYVVPQALYGAFCTYFVSVFSQDANAFVNVARWTAPLILATGLISNARYFVKRTRNFFISKRKNSCVIYCDPGSLNEANTLSADVFHSVVSLPDEYGDVQFFSKAQKQVLMFSDDQKAFEFYTKYEKQLEDKNVYIMLREISSGLLRRSNVTYLNLNEIVSDDYWKKYPAVTDMNSNHETHITIIGKSPLAVKILYRGLHLNMFYTDQKIIYHFYGNKDFFTGEFYDLKLVNEDRIIYEGENPYDYIKQISESDRIILTDSHSEKLLETLINSTRQTQIHFYSPENTDPAGYYIVKNIASFGSDCDIVTYHNILGSGLDGKAKVMYYYNYFGFDIADKKDINYQWSLLSGFEKNIYISESIYFELLTDLVAKGYVSFTDIDTLRRVNYAHYNRYCRLHHYHYGISEKGYDIEYSKRICGYLCGYENLSERYLKIMDFGLYCSAKVFNLDLPEGINTERIHFVEEESENGI